VPVSEFLYVVARHEIALYEYLQSHFPGMPQVEVTVDRRLGERRQQNLGYPVERRGGERRRHCIGEQLRKYGWALVRQDHVWGSLKSSVRIRDIEEKISRVVHTDAIALIRGKRGVGKDFVARLIHSVSPRQGRPFIKVNCATTPGERLESELFGHEKGAFPEGHRRKIGRFEFANTGTIFLDEIGEVPPSLQGKLLQVLRDHQFSRIGGREMIQVDVRVVVSTTPKAEGAAGMGGFWEELSRLNAVEIDIPPLRERTEEIPHLALSFLARFNEQYQQNVELSRATLAVLMEYPWPGNVRELEDVIRRFVVTGSSTL